MIRLNNKGLSLVELLAATATGAVVLFAIFSIHTYMMKSQMTSMNSMDSVDLKFEVAAIVSQEDNCSSILAGKTSIAGQPIVISSTLASNSTWAGGRVHIASVQLQGIKSLGSGKVTAKIQIAGTRSGSTGTTSFTEYVPVNYSVNSSNVITTCKDDTPICTAMGGVWVSSYCNFCVNLGGVLRADGTCGAGS